MKFDYFQGPISDMASLSEKDMVCSFCNHLTKCFKLEYAINVSADVAEGGFGCGECLAQGRFEFWHDTDIGMLDQNGLTKVYTHNKPPPEDFPESALVALRRTPQFVTWQQELWLTHCNDFMSYQGTWQPADFYRNAKDGDGRSLFLEMTDEYKNLWDDSLPKDRSVLKEWHAAYYVFRCRHCGQLKGNWDCD